MRLKLVGNKRDSELSPVMNGDVTIIPRGTPLVLSFTANSPQTNDGLLVVLPSTAGAIASQELLYGVSTDPTTNFIPNAIKEAIVSGYCAYALITVNTRSATNAVWPSYASSASLAVLEVDTANNAFSILTASAGTAALNLPGAVLLDSIASATTQASTLGGGLAFMTASSLSFSQSVPASIATASVISARVFLKLL